MSSPPQPPPTPALDSPAEAVRQLQQVFDATTDAIFLLDRNYNFSFLNRRAQELLSASGNLIGRNLWTTYPNTVYEDSPFQRVYQAAMDQRVPGKFEAFYPAPLDAWLAVEARPTDDGIIVFFRDVTEQRLAAEEIERKSTEVARQAAEIEALYANAPIGLALFDVEDFRYLRLNNRQAEFFGLKPEEIVGRTLTEMAPIQGLRELFESVRDGNPVVNYPLEGELISHPGEHRYWTVNYLPVYAQDGTVQAITAASLEITAQRRAEKALIQSEKLAAVGRLASSISHEINNPLEAITNLLYLVGSSKELPHEIQDWVHQAQAELARVSQITIQSLRFHRQSMRPTLVTASELLEPVLNLYRGRLLNSAIQVQTRISSTKSILCLENEIRQVLSNLISNAIDAIRLDGTLFLRAHDAVDSTGRRGVTILIADTGQGMSAQTRSRIFEPFFTTKELNGTGLGLWISVDIVQRHGGTLKVRSTQHPNHHGTVFSLFLPLVPDA
jgi:PAS domain S-box-containing protein